MMEKMPFFISPPYHVPPMTHGSSREEVVAILRGDEALSRAYQVLFGPLPEPDDSEGTDRAFVNVGKCLAAFVSRLTSDRAPFDVFVEGLVEDDIKIAYWEYVSYCKISQREECCRGSWSNIIF